MPTIAEKLAKKPTPEIEALVAEVQAVANDTQSYAYRFEDQEDGSRLEIRCAAQPRFAGEPPVAGPGQEGVLCLTDSGLLRLHSNQEIAYARVELTARAELHDQIAKLAENEQDTADAEAIAAGYRQALERTKPISGGHEGVTHTWLPVDDRTRAFHEELGAGGSALVAHPAAGD